MDFRQTLIDFLVVAIPGVVLYFTGWAYLSAYLDFFGVNISELTLDVPTIFIYSYSPIGATFRAHQSTIILTILLTAIVSVLLFVSGVRIPASEALRNFWKYASAKAIGIVVIGIVIIQFVIVPLVQWSALRAANLVWQGQATSIEIAHDARSSRWIGNYQLCAERRALHVVFSDTENYFSLCRSELEPESGVVFHFGRNGELISTRPVRRPE